MEISSAFIDRQKQLLLFGKSQQSRVSDADTTYALSPEVEHRSAVRFQAEQNGIGDYVGSLHGNYDAGVWRKE